MLIITLSFILLNNLNHSNSFGISDPSFNVKIIHPYKNDTLTNKENILVKGTATYDSSQDCSVSLIVNNKKPYFLVTPKGNNETNDFTQWEFVIDKNSTKHKLIDGVNKITAKNYCMKALSSAFYSIFFNLSSTMDSFKQSDIGDTMITSVNATAAAAAPSNATPTNVICCKNLSGDKGEGKDTPATMQDKPIRLVSTNDADDEKSSFEGERSAESFAEEIQSNIDYLYSKDGDNLGSIMLDNHGGAQDGHGDESESESESDEPRLKDVGNYNVEGDGLHDIKNTIENALS